MSHLLRQAADIVHAGGIIAYPTEAVFGLGCAPDNETAVSNLLALKQRSSEKGLIIIAAEFSQLQYYCAPLPETQQQEVHRTWPGPVTWLFPVSDSCPIWLCGNHATIAVRVTAHPIAADLCRECHSALVSTSANVTDQLPARTAEQVKAIFPHGLNLIVDGDTNNMTKPTTIRDALSGQVIRE